MKIKTSRATTTKKIRTTSILKDQDSK